MARNRQQDADLAEVNRVFPVLLTELAQKWDQQVAECDSECQARLEEIDREHHTPPGWTTITTRPI